MGENDMFEGLGDELKQSSESESSDAASSESTPADPSPSSSSTDVSSSTEAVSSEEDTQSSDTDSADDTPLHDQPAFPFVNEYVESIYPRPETWDEFWDVVDLDLERTFRDHGVRNMSGREIHDAALRLAAENPDALARIALEARGIEYDPDE